MTEMLTKSGGGEYNIHFRTDNPEAYKTVQEICRLYIGKERLTPKKVIPHRSTYTNDVIFYACPSCKETDLGDGCRQNPCCEYCGQALDWSDTE